MTNSSLLKTCRTCQKKLSITNFNAYKSRNGKTHPDCRECYNKRSREKNKIPPKNPLPDRKVCNGCKKEFPISNFPTKGVGRVHTRCKKCCKVSQQNLHERYKKRRPDEITTPEEKKCSVCAKILPASKFGIMLTSKDGLRSYCKACDANKTKEWVNKTPERIEKRRIESKQWRINNPERFKANQKKWLEQNYEKVLQYTNANTRRYRKLFPERYIEARKRVTESGKGAAYKKKRDAKKRNALPPWLNESDLYPLYQLAQDLSKDSGEKWEVDHIDPLQSDLICGLHTFENLEVIKAKDNRIKGNKFIPYRIDSNNNKWELKGEEWIEVIEK